MPPVLTQIRGVMEHASDVGRRLYSAWRSEMALLFDETIGARLSRSATKARLTASATELVLSVRSAGEWAEVARCSRPLDPAGLPESMSAMAAALPSTVREIEIQWPDDRTLRRAIDLPNAARARLQSAVELQLDRLTPFRPEHIYFACDAVGTSPRDGHFQAGLAVAPRLEVDTWMRGLDAAGTRSLQVTASLNPGKSIVLARKRGRPATHWANRAEWVLAGTLACLTALAVGTAAWHQHVEQRLIDERLDALRPQATKAEETRAALEQRLRQVTFLNQQFAGFDTAQLLSALNRDLPVDSWLFQVQQEGHTVTLSGFAKNASSIAVALEKEPLFANAQLRSAIQQPGGGNERFDIIVTLRAPLPANGAAR